MTKIVVIGDIHARDKWKRVVAEENDFDKIVFMGDYFDTRDEIPHQKWVDNFRDIVEFKRMNMDKVVLLIGNHDYHYMRGITEIYTGYTPVARFDVQEILDRNADILQACFKHDNFLFTHAGVTNTWYKNGLKLWCKERGIDITDLDICDQINYLFQYAPDQFKFTSGRYLDNYADEVTQTPIWVRPLALMTDRLGKYFHVVGHTFETPEIKTDHNPGGVITTDALGIGYYVVIHDGIPEIKRLEYDQY